mmetsp:Transcript_1022/g.3214  ORF Transcript_1022/g.3214 Transcript_1022/m.3214 type:complete len:686 (-) Transcript_1022:1763-3820(-)
MDVPRGERHRADDEAVAAALVPGPRGVDEARVGEGDVGSRLIGVGVFKGVVVLVLVEENRVAGDAVEPDDVAARRAGRIRVEETKFRRCLGGRQGGERVLHLLGLRRREARDADRQLQQARESRVADDAGHVARAVAAGGAVLGRRRRGLDGGDKVSCDALYPVGHFGLKLVVLGLRRQRDEALEEDLEGDDGHALSGDAHVEGAARAVVGAVDVAHDVRLADGVDELVDDDGIVPVDARVGGPRLREAVGVEGLGAIELLDAGRRDALGPVSVEAPRVLVRDAKVAIVPEAVPLGHVDGDGVLGVAVWVDGDGLHLLDDCVGRQVPLLAGEEGERQAEGGRVVFDNELVDAVVRVDVEIIDARVEGVVDEARAGTGLDAGLQPAAGRAKLLVELGVAVATGVHLVPDDDGQAARAWEIRRARDAGTLKGSPAAARLVDAGVLVRVGRADVAAALRGAGADVQVEGDVVRFGVSVDRAAGGIGVGPAALGVGRALAAVGVLGAVVRAELAVHEDAAVRALGVDVGLVGAALRPGNGPRRDVAQADGLARRAGRVAMQATAVRQVRQVIGVRAQLVVVVEARRLEANDGALGADQAEARVEDDHLRDRGNGVRKGRAPQTRRRPESVRLLIDIRRREVGRVLDLNVDDAVLGILVIQLDCHVPVGNLIQIGDAFDEEGVVHVLQQT